MGLSTREQHALDSIEDRLAESDPRLTSLLATFTRLTDGEGFPERENIRARPRLSRLQGKLPWALLWLIVSAAVIGVGLTLSRGGGGGGRGSCSTWLVPGPCSVSAPAHSAQHPHTPEFGLP